MKTFRDLEFVAHPSHIEGVQARITFDNGYGASVVKILTLMVAIRDCMNWLYSVRMDI